MDMDFDFFYKNHPMDMEKISKSAQLEQPQEKKIRFEQCGENAESKEANLSEEKAAYEDENEGTAGETPLDLPNRNRQRLPLEMECEIFKSLKRPIQCKFIWGMGRGIYGIFGHQLLTKTKRLCNPKQNCWRQYRPGGHCFSPVELIAHYSNGPHVYAEKGFPIRVDVCRQQQNGFPGTIVYYYEITQLGLSEHCDTTFVGLTNQGAPKHSIIGYYPNSYAIKRSPYYYGCRLEGQKHRFKLPRGATRPQWIWNDPCTGDVIGCGLVLSPQNKWAIFFTANGTILGKPFPISPSAQCGHLYPAVRVHEDVPLRANFGDNPDMPFEYDVKECPGLVFE